MEQALRPFAGSQQADAGRAGLEAQQSYPLGIAAEGADVFPDPLQRRDLIKQPEVQGVRAGLPAGNLRKVDKPEDAEAVIEADKHHILMRADIIVAVQQRIDRAAGGKIAVVEQHEHRLFRLSLFGPDGDIQGQAVLALPVMPDDGALVLYLYGGSAEIPRLKHRLGRRQRLGRLPSQLAHRRFGIGDAQKDVGFLILLPDIDAGSRPDRAVGVVFALNCLVLPVHFLEILVRHVKHISLAAVPVAFSDLPHPPAADEQVHDQAQNGKADDEHKFLLQVFYQGNAHPPDGSILSQQKDEQDRSIGKHPVRLALLNRFAEDDLADELLQPDTEDKTCRPAQDLRPAGKLCDGFAKAIAQRRDERHHEIVNREQFLHTAASL